MRVEHYNGKLVLTAESWADKSVLAHLARDGKAGKLTPPKESARVLDMAIRQGPVTARMLCDTFGWKLPQSNGHLTKLVSLGLLRRENMPGRKPPVFVYSLVGAEQPQVWEPNESGWIPVFERLPEVRSMPPDVPEPDTPAARVWAYARTAMGWATVKSYYYGGHAWFSPGPEECGPITPLCWRPMVAGEAAYSGPPFCLVTPWILHYNATRPNGAERI